MSVFSQREGPLEFVDGEGCVTIRQSPSPVPQEQQSASSNNLVMPPRDLQFVPSTSKQYPLARQGANSTTDRAATNPSRCQHASPKAVMIAHRSGHRLWRDKLGPNRRVPGTTDQPVAKRNRYHADPITPAPSGISRRRAAPSHPTDAPRSKGPARIEIALTMTPADTNGRHAAASKVTNGYRARPVSPRKYSARCRAN